MYIHAYLHIIIVDPCFRNHRYACVCVRMYHDGSWYIMRYLFIINYEELHSLVLKYSICINKVSLCNDKRSRPFQHPKLHCLVPLAGQNRRVNCLYIYLYMHVLFFGSLLVVVYMSTNWNWKYLGPGGAKHRNISFAVRLRLVQMRFWVAQRE